MMNWVFTTFSLIQILISLFTLFVALRLWQHRAVSGSRALALMMLCVTIWALATGIETASISTQAKIFWSKVEYIGIAPAPVLFLLFILGYTNQEKLFAFPRTVLLWAVPLVTFLMALTNEWHGLMWNSFTRIPGTNLMLYGHGTWFWVNVVFAYGIMVLALAMLLSATVRSPQYYRQQAFSLIVASFFPWLGNIAYVTNIAPGEDLTPVGFAVCGIIITFSMARLGLFDLVPVAREQVIEWMELGLLILDDRDRVVDINESARRLLAQLEGPLPLPKTGWVGQPAARIASAWPDFARVLPFASEGNFELTLNGNEPRILELRVSILSGKRGRRTGKMLLLNDITRLKQVQQEALRAREIAEILSQTSNALGSAPSLTAGLDIVLEQAGRVVACDGGMFLLRDDGSLHMGTQRGLDLDAATLEQFCPVPPDEGNEDGAWSAVKAEITACLNAKGAGICSELWAPIYYKENLSGALLLFRRSPQAFTPDDEHVAQALAVQVSIALENARMFTKVQNQAITDGLTGLTNRRHFFTLAVNLYEHALRYSEPYAIIIMDIDHFKRVNDRYGHLSGDEVLRALAALCKGMLRKIDILGRYGGEEFVVALPNTSLENAVQVAERLRLAIASASFEYRGQSIHITVSQGVAALAHDQEEFETVLERADRALYAAKNAGRNCVRTI